MTEPQPPNKDKPADLGSERVLALHSDTAEQLLTLPPDVSLLIDRNGIIFGLNDAAADRFGHRAEVLIGTSLWALFPDDDVSEALAQLLRVFETGRPHRCQNQWRGAWFDHVLCPILGPGGEVAQIAIVAREITERVKVAHELRETQDRYRKLFEESRDAIYITSREGEVMATNEACLGMLGYDTLDDLKDHLLDTFVDPQQREEFQRQIEENGSVRDFELHLRTKGGEELIVLDTSSVWRDGSGEIAGYQGIMRDVTEQHRADEALRDSEAKYRSLFDNIADPILIFDEATGQFLDANHTALVRYGYTLEELRGMTPLHLHPQHEIEEIRKTISKPTAGSKTCTHVTKSGEAIPVEIHCEHFEYDGRKAWICVTRDISQRLAAQASLQQSQEKFARLFHHSNDAVFIHDPQGNILDVNRRAEALFGYTRDELLALTVAELHPPPTSQRPSQDTLSLLADDGELRVEDEFVRKDGQTFPGEVSASMFDLAGETVIQGIVRDLSRRRRAEERQRLESVGILAGGIAHDFNNLLAVILGNVSLARRRATDAAVDDLLEKAERTSLKARDLTQQLLIFSKGGAPVRRTKALAPLIQEAARFALHGSNVSCEFEIAPDLLAASVDDGLFRQVIQNIVINADQAMPDGGRLVIRAANLPAEERDPSVPLPTEGLYVRIEIEDEGEGIPARIRGRIFDPYFTTRDKKAGLGLATAYAIVTKHDGVLTVASEEGVGTGFTIYLPAVDPKDDSTENEPIELPRGSGKVLIMDDEPLVLDVLATLLDELGYDVETASDGAGALAKYQEALERSARYDVVLLDLTVPGGTGGKQAIKSLVEIDPDVRAIVCSGYSNDPIMGSFEEFGFLGALCKPFQIEQVARLVAHVIRS